MIFRVWAEPWTWYPGSGKPFGVGDAVRWLLSAHIDQPDHPALSGVTLQFDQRIEHLYEGPLGAYRSQPDGGITAYASLLDMPAAVELPDRLVNPLLIDEHGGGRTDGVDDPDYTVGRITRIQKTRGYVPQVGNNAGHPVFDPEGFEDIERADLVAASDSHISGGARVLGWIVELDGTDR